MLTVATSTPDNADVSSLEEATAVFVGVSPQLRSIACRILGSWGEAEDIVQDAWVRWQTCDRDNVRNPIAFLVKMTARLAVNSTRSARVRRESYVGDWPSEPVDPAQDPTLAPERREDLELAIRRLMERLQPTERAAFILRKAFDYPYATIADTLQLTEANTRQLVSRAGRRLATDDRHTAPTAGRRHLVNAFVAAARTGEMTQLEDLLAA